MPSKHVPQQNLLARLGNRPWRHLRTKRVERREGDRVVLRGLLANQTQETLSVYQEALRLARSKRRLADGKAGHIQVEIPHISTGDYVRDVQAKMIRGQIVADLVSHPANGRFSATSIGGGGKSGAVLLIVEWQSRASRRAS